MVYKTFVLRSTTAQKAKTEIMYEVASAHAAGTELLRINITKDDAISYKRIHNSVVKILKEMKGSSLIQFYATQDTFAEIGTEAQFLFNKYPDIFENIPKENDGLGFIYVRV